MAHLSTIAALPRPLTQMVGRDRESAGLFSLLGSGDRRFVTLTGPGGIGKTRLALHLAAELEVVFPGGVAFVPLSSFTDPAPVMSTLGRICDVDWHSPADTAAVARGFGPQPVLLVLDNLEQIPDIGFHLATLMQFGQELSILATSQRRLGIEGEILFALDPLDLPPPTLTDIEAIKHFACVHLFAQRAHNVNIGAIRGNEDWRAVAEICRTLDGIPLAIELAAARSNVLSPTALLPRLEQQLPMLTGERIDVPSRLRTMRNAIRWTYDLLGDDERLVFLYLSRFESGFGLSAIDWICQQRGVRRDPLDILDSLISRSLLRRQAGTGEGRYIILSALREFGKEQLRQTGLEHDACLVRASFARAVVDRCNQGLVEHHQVEALRELDHEFGTLRASMEWALTHRHPTIALHMAGHLWRYAETRGITVELRGWLMRALAQTAHAGDDDVAHAWISLGYVHVLHEAWDDAEAAFRSAVAHATAPDQQRTLAQAYCGMGRTLRGKGDIPAARGWLDRAAVLVAATGFARAGVTVQANRAELLLMEGEMAAAKSLFDRCIDQLDRLGDRACVAATLTRASGIELARGKPAESLALLERALEIDRALGSTSSLALTLIGLGAVWHALGKTNQAVSSLEEAITTCQDNGLRRSETTARLRLATVALDAGDRANALAQCADVLSLLGASSRPADLVACANLLLSLCCQAGRPSGAASIAAMLDAPELTPPDGAIVDRLQAIAQSLADVPGGGLASPSNDRLTPREREILTLLTREYSTAEIAQTLFISQRTVTTHISNALTKLGVRSRTEAVARMLGHTLPTTANLNAPYAERRSPV